VPCRRRCGPWSSRLAELQRLVGKKEEQIEFLKKNRPASGTTERRQAIAEERGSLTAQEDARCMDLPRSTFYYQSSTMEDRLEAHLDLQDRDRGGSPFDWSGYGYRRSPPSCIGRA